MHVCVCVCVLKEKTVVEEELIKTGTLNLVDLAGSECVGRCGRCIHVCVCVCVYVYICMHVCVYTYVCMYVQEKVVMIYSVWSTYIHLYIYRSGAVGNRKKEAGRINQSLHTYIHTYIHTYAGQELSATAKK